MLIVKFSLNHRLRDMIYRYKKVLRVDNASTPPSLAARGLILSKKVCVIAVVMADGSQPMQATYDESTVVCEWV